MNRMWTSVRSVLATLVILVLAGCGGGDAGFRIGDEPIRGGGSLQQSDTFAAALTAAEQVPSSTSTALGSGSVAIDPTTRRMVAVVTTSGTIPSTVSIREAPEGVAGPIVFALQEAQPGTGVWSLTAGLSEDQVAALRAGRLYFDVTSVAFPQGELRGQIVAQSQAVPLTSGGSGLGSGAAGPGSSGPFTLSAILEGQQMIPPSPSVAQGTGTISINPFTRQISAAVATAGVVPASVLIELGATGTEGPALLALAPTSGGEVWLAREVVSEPVLEAMLNGNTYFIIRSAAFPDGELRGQILPHSVAATFRIPSGSNGLPTNDGRLGFGAGLPGAGSRLPGAFEPLAPFGAVPDTPLSGSGTTGFGVPVGTPGFGTTDFGATGFGNTGFGNTGFGNTGFGNTGFGNTGFGNTGFGATGFGATGFDTTGFDASGFNTTASGFSTLPGSGTGSAPSAPTTTDSTSPFVSPFASNILSAPTLGAAP